MAVSLTVVAIVIAILAVVMSWALYDQGQRAARRHDLDAAHALLTAVLSGIASWGETYFGTPYTPASIAEHAQQDHDAVLSFQSVRRFEIPPEPVALLVSGAATSSWIDQKTTEAAGLALWQLGVVNGLMRDQNEFGRDHRVDIADPNLSSSRREALASAAYQGSAILHQAIGAAAWYHKLIEALNQNIDELDRRLAWVELHAVLWRTPLKPGSQMPDAVGRRRR